MRIHVYEPLLHAIQTDDGREIPVPPSTTDGAKPGREVEAVRRWARTAGHITSRDRIGTFTSA